MKRYFFAIALFFPLLLTGQSVTYSVDAVSQDSIFLVETVTGAATKEQPRAQVTTTHVFFKGMEALERFVADIRAGAEKKRAEGEKLLREAGEDDKMASKINAALGGTAAAKPKNGAPPKT